MVGEPKYPPEQIYWVLDNVLKKTKNDAMSQGFLEIFGKTLTPTQIRYVKNKYGKDPDFNAPMINKRLEYLGSGTLNFPPGSGMVASTSSRITSGTGNAARAPSAHITPAQPSQIPIPSIEQPYTNFAQPIEQDILSGHTSHLGPATHASRGIIFASPNEAELNLPFGMFSPASRGGFLSGGELCASPRLISSQLDDSTLFPASLPAPTNVAGPSTAPKRPRGRADSTASPQPMVKRYKVDTVSGMAIAEAPRSLIQDQRQSQGQSQSDRNVQNITLPTTYETFDDPFQISSAIPMMQNPSMHPMPLYNSADISQNLDFYPFWDQAAFSQQASIAVDPMLQPGTPIRPSLQGTPIFYQNELSRPGTRDTATFHPHLIPLPADSTFPSVLQQGQRATVQTPAGPIDQTLLPTPQLYQELISPADLENEQEQEIKQEPIQNPLLARPPSEPSTEAHQSLIHAHLPAEELRSRSLATEAISASELPTNPLQCAEDDRGLPQEATSPLPQGEFQDLFNPEDFLLDLEPLVWAAQADSPGKGSQS